MKLEFTYHFRLYLCERLLGVIVSLAPKRDDGLVLIATILEYLEYVVRVNKLDMAQETLDVLNDHGLMQQMADSEEDYKAGRCAQVRDLVAELEDN